MCPWEDAGENGGQGAESEGWMQTSRWKDGGWAEEGLLKACRTKYTAEASTDI